MNHRFATVLVVVIFAIPMSMAQTDPTAGIIPFSTGVGSIYDRVDLATSNILVTLLVRNKIGKIPFSFNLLSNSHAYIYTTPDGKQHWGVDSGFVGRPFAGDMGATLGFTQTSPTCKGQADTELTNFFITDATGAIHALPTSLVIDLLGCVATHATAMTQDGSGYTASVQMSSGTSVCLPCSNIYDRSGNQVIHGPSVRGASSYTVYETDPDGATIQASTTKQGLDFITSYTDTLNQNALTYDEDKQSWTYTDGSGLNQAFTINNSLFHQKTVFGCNGISDIDSGGVNASFPVSITTPVGTIGIGYEQTPGYSGYTTGRIAQITFPSGGSVFYAYSDSAGHNGINCASGVVPEITRTINDSTHQQNQYIWYYWNNNLSSTPSNFAATEADPAGNYTYYGFSGGFQTQAIFDQGNSSVLKTVNTCYGSNGSTPPVPPNCAAPSTIPKFPITETDVYTSLNTSTSNRVQTTFDSVYGNVTNIYNYDFGATSYASHTSIAYGTWNGSTCVAIGNYISDRPCVFNIQDGSNNYYKQNIVTYSVTGHPTTEKHLTLVTPPYAYLTVTKTYGTNGASPGVLSSVADANGTTSYSNFVCNGMLPETVTYPLSSVGSTSLTWDSNCIGGVVTSTTDPNQQPTHFYYNDPLWRQTKVTFPDGGSISTGYSTGSPPWTISTTTAISSGQNETTAITLDGLGRPVQSATTDPNSSTGYRYVNTAYSNVGQVASITNPYFTTGDSTYGVTYYTYDAIGRLRTATQPDNTVVNYAYTNRAIQISGLTGLNRVSQIDGLGRTVYVCDGINATQQADNKNPSACGLDIPANGFLASYQYNPLGLQTYASYSGESRSFNYDGLGRITSSMNPETGSEMWTYDTTSVGMLYQHTDARSIVSTYSYDSMHRLSQISYSDGTTPTYNFYYDTQQGGGTGTNLKGRLALTKTSNASATLAESWFGYDAMGRVNNIGSCAPLVCPVNGATWSILGFTFNYDGSLATLSDPDVPDTLTYTRNSNGQLTGLTSSLHNTNLPQTLVSNVKYNAFGAVVSDTSADGYPETIGYDKMGRRTSFSAGSLYSFSLGYNSAGGVNSVTDSQMGTWTFGYDPYFFGRLTSGTCSANCPNGWGSLSWTYDEYGNRWKQIVTSGQGPQPNYTFDTHNHITGSGVVYDNAGNMTSDGLGDTYPYDANSRMVGQQGFKYVVDALGNRVASTNLSSGVETDYVYSGSTLVHRNNANVKGFGFESGFGIYYGNNSSHFYRNYIDQVATERVQTQYSTSGSAVHETCENLAFGDAFPCQHPQGGSGGDVYYFAGLFTDPGANGNDNHAVAREYSGTQGRWESPDPAGLAMVDPSNPQTWNRYVYVLNNPLSYRDPLGLFLCGDCGDDGGGDDGGGDGGGFDPCFFYGLFCGGSGQPPVGPPNGPGGGGPGGQKPGQNHNPPKNSVCNNIPSNGTTIPVQGNSGQVNFQFNGQGMLIGVGVQLTGNNAFQASGLGIPANTFAGFTQTSPGTVQFGFSNPVDIGSGLSQAYFQTATFSGGRYTSVQGAYAPFGIALGNSTGNSSLLQWGLNGQLPFTSDLGSQAQNFGSLLDGLSSLVSNNVSCKDVFGGG